MRRWHAEHGGGRTPAPTERRADESEAQPEAPATNAAQAAEVRTAVRAAARQCYERASASGDITVRVSVGANGRAYSGIVTNNGTGNQEVARCVSGALIGRRFGGGSGGGVYEVSYSG